MNQSDLEAALRNAKNAQGALGFCAHNMFHSMGIDTGELETPSIKLQRWKLMEDISDMRDIEMRLSSWAARFRTHHDMKGEMY